MAQGYQKEVDTQTLLSHKAINMTTFNLDYFEEIINL